MNPSTRLDRKRAPLQKIMIVVLVIAAITLARVQAKPVPRNIAGRRFSQLPSIGNTLRKTTELQGGFSSLAQDDTVEKNANGEQETPPLSDNQQIISQPAETTPPSTQQSSSASTPNNNAQLGAWPCMDELDKTLIKISLPVIANFAIAPLVGTIDLFFINRMGNALAVAGQAAANQVFGSVFWLTSFLPSRKISPICLCLLARPVPYYLAHKI